MKKTRKNGAGLIRYVERESEKRERETEGEIEEGGSPVMIPTTAVEVKTEEEEEEEEEDKRREEKEGSVLVEAWRTRGNRRERRLRRRVQATLQVMTRATFFRSNGGASQQGLGQDGMG